MMAYWLRIREWFAQRILPVVLERWKLFSIGGGVLLILLGVGAFLLLRPTPPPPRVDLHIAYPPWDCARTTALLLEATLEVRLKQEVKRVEVPVDEMWRRVAEDEVDLAVAAWLPDSQKSYQETYKLQTIDLGPYLEGARMGMAVTADSPAQTYADLATEASVYGGVIYGIDPESAQMGMARRALEDYGLSAYDLREGSVRTLDEALAQAKAEKKAVVVVVWSPHWLFGKYKLRWLSDPKGVFAPPEEIHMIANLKLKAKAPQAYEALSRVRLTPAQLNEAIYTVGLAENQLIAARRWVQDHPEIVDTWLADQK